MECATNSTIGSTRAMRSRCSRTRALCSSGMRPSSWASITSWCFANRDQPAGRPSTPGPGQPRFSQPASAPGRCADRPRLPVAGPHPAAGVWRLPRGLPGELPARRPPARQRQRSIRPLPDVRLLRADGPQYVMPPPLAWLLQPLIAVDSRAITVATILVLNASLFVFVLCALRALKVDEWQLGVLLVLVAISFEPVIGNIDEGQINLVLLALSGAWLWSWAGDWWWGGIAMGAAVALKMIQAPIGLLILWARRWSMLAAAIITGLGLLLLAAPQYLVEYLTSVLPSISQGTGLYENHSPGGTITRLLEPDTFLGVVHGSPPAARVITLVISLAALAVTFVVLRSPAASRNGLALEAAAVIAVTPIVTSYSWGTHLVLLLVPILVLVAWGVRRRDWTVLALVAAGYLLLGVGHNRMQTLLVTGYSNLLVLRLMAELGVLGILAIWIAALMAVRRELSSGP